MKCLLPFSFTANAFTARFQYGIQAQTKRFCLADHPKVSTNPSTIVGPSFERQSFDDHGDIRIVRVQPSQGRSVVPNIDVGSS